MIFWRRWKEERHIQKEWEKTYSLQQVRYRRELWVDAENRKLPDAGMRWGEYLDALQKYQDHKYS